MANTRPRKVTSPVMATSRRTGMPVRADTMAVAMATPADGPSLGTAPSGKWTWMSLLLWKSASSPNWSARLRRKDRAARADSRITLPRLPVSSTLPLPGITLASTSRISPPTAVQARPLTTPTKGGWLAGCSWR